MTFLHPLLLAGLALTALPIVIHLINQLRYRTIRWGAMMFLLQANRMSRGLARLRQWLILLMRMLAIACLVFVISRPLSSGWMGWSAAGRADTTIIVLDRSPSMLDSSGGRSKLFAARAQLAKALGRLSSTRWVLIESATTKPRELESPAALEQLPETAPTSASADLPAMLARAHDYIVANQTGRTEIWICSDLRTNDWNADDARWSELRSEFSALPQPVRFHLLAYSQPPPGDLAVHVTALKQRKVGDGAELLVSLRLSHRDKTDDSITVPVQFEIGGARSTLNVEAGGTGVEVRDHRIPLDRRHQRGWGRVSIPADANLADNEYYFTFDTTQSAHTVIVSDEGDCDALRLMASIAPDSSGACSAQVVPVAEVADISWDKAALVLWQAPLPQGDAAGQLAGFIDNGGQVIFFPSRQASDRTAFGLRWGSWSAVPDDAVIDRWRGDEDLLANTQSGAALPVGRLKLRNVCSLIGDSTPLASLHGGAAVLARATTPQGGVYFCATTPAASDSNMAGEGVVLYAAIQRALAAGMAARGNARQIVAGSSPAEAAASWRKLAGHETVLSSEYAVQAGAYTSGDVLLAVNRSEEEDAAGVLADDRLTTLFEGLDFTRIEQVVSRERSLVEEIWRPFLIAMMVALFIEAWLCLPRPAPADSRTTFAMPGRTSLGTPLPTIN